MSSKSLHFHTVGQTYHQFTLTKLLKISELHCTLFELTHEPTGAQVMHIANDDPENMFCLSFKTIPTTSNGIAHVLEHTVLCGSKNFPVKDPFFSMQRRSLNTFMNALTGADFTCYPAASQVSKDFYNLLEVYIDAVFRPNLNELSFLQEGHRLEFFIPNDPDSSLEFKGIVFNEMKGALASPSSRLHEAMNAALFPDVTYGINSGGDPKNILDLTYQELCDFHQTFYHPSRCLYFFYGNMPLLPHLDFISEHVLNQTQPASPLPKLSLQPRFEQPKRLKSSYPISEEGETHNKALIAFGWLTCHILNQQELLALSIIDIILMNTDASTLKMAFLKSRLCKQAVCFMDIDIPEIPIVIELKGCNEEDADVLEKLMRKTLLEIVQKGIPLNQIENAIHQLEFYRSEITGDHAPFGLSLFMRSALLKQHGGDAEDGLKIHTLLEELRKINLKDPHYFTGLIKKHFLDNPHFVRLTMVPSKELAAAELAEERKKLSTLQKTLSKMDKDRIVRKAAELSSFQEKQEEEDPDILPKVTLNDIPKSSNVYPLKIEKIDNITAYHHTCFTNEIVYADLIFHLPHLSQEELPYVRLFTTLLSQMGCAGRSYAQNLEYIEANTGGVGASLILNMHAQDHEQFFPSLFIRGKALHRKANKLFSLILEMTSSIDFTDIPRLREVILKQYSALENTLSKNGLKYALSLSASGLDVPSTLSYLWYGLHYFWMIRDLAQEFESKVSGLIEKLQQLQLKLLCTENPDLVISSDAEIYDSLKRHGFYGLSSITTVPQKKWDGNYPLIDFPSQGRVIATPVSFIGKVIKTVSYVHPDAPALSIASFLLDNITLHAKLREQGGAYGGGAVNNATSGNFYFYSYRDPNIYSTLEAFNLGIETLVEGDFEESDIEEAKLEMIQALDAPLSPGSRADIAYGWLQIGKTVEIRQAFRNRVLSLTREEIIHAVKTHLIPNLVHGATVVFAGRELLEKENQKFIDHGISPLPIKNI
jgi:presequence protease